MKTLTLTIIALSLIGITTAQVPTPQDIKDGSSCNAHATKHLLQATDPLMRAEQEWNLNAAKAYQELEAMGFKECE